MAGKIRYAYLNEAAVIFDDDKAFEYFGGQWRSIHMADAMSKAKLLSKAEFDKYAGAAALKSLPL